MVSLLTNMCISVIVIDCYCVEMYAELVFSKHLARMSDMEDVELYEVAQEDQKCGRDRHV